MIKTYRSFEWLKYLPSNDKNPSKGYIFEPYYVVKKYVGFNFFGIFDSSQHSFDKSNNIYLQ